MPNNRGLDLLSFVRGLEPETAERYFVRVGMPETLRAQFSVFFGTFPQYAADPSAAEVVKPILEDFTTVYQLTEHGPGILIRAHHRFRIEFDDTLSLQELGLRLLLDHPHAYKFARSRLLLQGGGGATSVFNLGVPGVEINSENMAALQEGISEWFRHEGKGEQCLVRHFVDSDVAVILVERGYYVQTQPFWTGRTTIAVDPRRPAIEDVLSFDPTTSELRVRSSLERDRETYLRLFALHVVGNGRLADESLRRQVFTLEPFQNQTFNYGGHGPIRGIVFVGARVRIYGASNLIAWFTADDIRSAFKYDLGGLSIDSVQLLAVKLRFKLAFPDEKPTTMTFTLEPPTETSIGERRHADLVIAYLRKQGVWLQ